MPASITVNQVTRPAGVAGKARSDLVVGQLVTCSNTTVESSYTWTLTDVPIRSALVRGTTGSGNTLAFTPDVKGSYRVTLRVNGSVLSADNAVALGAIRTFAAKTLGWRYPAANEEDEDNEDKAGLGFPGNVNARGWSTDLDTQLEQAELAAYEVANAVVVSPGVGSDALVGLDPVTGKLHATVIPAVGSTTGLTITEGASVPGGAPAAGTGVLWVRNDVPNVLVFTDDVGTDLVIGEPGAPTDAAYLTNGPVVGLSAEVDVTGNNNVTVGGTWTFANATTALTVAAVSAAAGADSSKIKLTGNVVGPAARSISLLNEADAATDTYRLRINNNADAALATLDAVGKLTVTDRILSGNGTAALPGHAFTLDPGTGLWLIASGRVALMLADGGAGTPVFDADYNGGQTLFGFCAAGTQTYPSWALDTDRDTGGFWPVANTFAITVGGQESIRFTDDVITMQSVDATNGFTLDLYNNVSDAPTALIDFNLKPAGVKTSFGNIAAIFVPFAGGEAPPEVRSFIITSDANNFYLNSGSGGTIEYSATGDWAHTKVTAGTSGPIVTYYHDKSVVGAAEDITGSLIWKGESTTNVVNTLAKINVVATNATNDAEDERFEFYAITGGTLGKLFEIRGVSGGIANTAPVFRSQIGAAVGAPGFTFRVNDTFSSANPILSIEHNDGVPVWNAFATDTRQKNHTAYANSDQISLTGAFQSTATTNQTAWSLTLVDGRTYLFIVRIVGRSSTGGALGSSAFIAHVHREGGAAVIDAQPSINKNFSDVTWDAAFTTSTNDLLLSVHGNTGGAETVNWAFYIEYQSVNTNA